MSKPVKLTDSQYLLLNELVKHGPQHVVDYYRPGKRLVTLGLAERDKHGLMCATQAGVKRHGLPS